MHPKKRRYDYCPFPELVGRKNPSYWWVPILGVFGVALLFPVGRYLLLFAAIQLVVTAIHEGGHLAAALRLRYRVDFVRIGPFKIIWGYGRFRAAVGGVALDGCVVATPPDHSYAPEREAMFIGAGPLANVIAALALSGLYMLLEAVPTAGSVSSFCNLAGGIAGLVAVWSGLAGLYNLFPVRTLRRTSDGAHLVELIQRARALRRRY